jgi:uncharacterized protein (DUF697 family)
MLNPLNLVSYVKSLYMTRQERAQELVRRQVLWSMGAGLLPIPGVDIAAVTAIQLDMVSKLCELYKIEFNKNVGKSLVTALVGGTAAKLGSSALKMIPVVGGVLGGVSMVVLSGASTYATGDVLMSHFEKGGTLESLDLETGRKLYEQAFEKGKEFALRLEDDVRSGRIKDTISDAFGGEDTSQPVASTTGTSNAGDDVFAKLEKLNALREKGILTDEEFASQKQKLLQQL